MRERAGRGPGNGAIVTERENQPTALQHDLAHRILQYARWSDLAAGTHLREAELAERFHVSRSPIRAALRLLGEKDLVEHSPHQGAFLRVAGREVNPDVIREASAPEHDLYRRVVRDRLAGTLPNTVSMSELARIYSASRARLRRLLADMLDEGLIERLPGQRWRFVHVLTSDQVYDASYRFRLIVEPAALLEPGFSADESELDDLIAVHERLIDGEVRKCSYSYLYQADAAFHESIARWSGNAFIAQSVQKQNRLRRLTEYQYYEDRARMLASCREHAAVLEAVREHQPERASQLMYRHIDTSWQFRPAFPVDGGPDDGVADAGGDRGRVGRP